MIIAIWGAGLATYSAISNAGRDQAKLQVLRDDGPDGIDLVFGKRNGRDCTESFVRKVIVSNAGFRRVTVSKALLVGKSSTESLNHLDTYRGPAHGYGGRRLPAALQDGEQLTVGIDLLDFAPVDAESLVVFSNLQEPIVVTLDAARLPEGHFSRRCSRRPNPIRPPKSVTG